MKKLAFLVALLTASTAFGQMDTTAKQELEFPNALSTNPGFENGTVGWTVSGGTFTTVTAAATVKVHSGRRAASYDAASSGQYFESSLSALGSQVATAQPGLLCKASFYYTGSGQLINAAVLTASSSVIQQAGLLTTTTDVWSYVEMFWPCTPNDQTYKLRFTSAGNPGVLYVDQVYIGHGLHLDPSNMVKGGDAETGSAGWITYADAAAVTPADGSGGTPDVFFSSLPSISTINGQNVFQFSKPSGDHQGQGVALRSGVANEQYFLDDLAFSTTSTLSFKYITSGLVTGDMVLFYYNGTTMLRLGEIPASTSVRSISFPVSLSDTATNRFIFHMATATTTAITMYMDDVALRLDPPSVARELSAVKSPNNASGWLSSGTGVTVATTATSTDLPLAGVADTAIKITPVSGTSDYARYRFTLPTTFQNRKLKAAWEQRPLSGYASGDLKFDVWCDDDSAYGSPTELALSTDASGISGIPNSTQPFRTTFDTDSTNIYCELRYTRTSGTTALNIANVVVGPGIPAQGAAIGAWESFTPSFTGCVTAAVECLYTGSPFGYKRRVADSMEIYAGFRKSGAAGSGAQGLVFAVPDSKTINTSVVSTDSNYYLGYWSLTGANYDALGARLLMYNSTTSLAFQEPGAGTSWSGADVAASAYYTIRTTIPISEWAGSGTVNLGQSAQEEYAYNTSGTTGAATSNLTAFGYGPAGVVIGSINSAGGTGNTIMRVRFATPILPTDIVEVQIGDDTPSSGAEYHWTAASARGFGRTGANSVAYGVAALAVASSSTDVDVYFGNGGATPQASTAFGGAGTAWSVLGLYRWRVVKYAGAHAIGFSHASATESGLVNTTTQTFNGVKQFNSGVFVGATAALGSEKFSAQETGTSATQSFRSKIPVPSSGTSYHFYAQDASGAVAYIDHAGNVTANGAIIGGSFRTGSSAFTAANASVTSLFTMGVTSQGTVTCTGLTDATSDYAQSLIFRNYTTTGVKRATIVASGFGITNTNNVVELTNSSGGTRDVACTWTLTR